MLVLLSRDGTGTKAGAALGLPERPGDSVSVRVWRPVPRRQRSAVDVPVSFSQARDLRGERQRGVTFSCRFSFNLGVSDPQCTATYQQSVDAVPQQLHDVALVPSSVCVRLLSDQHNLC